MSKSRERTARKHWIKTTRVMMRFVRNKEQYMEKLKKKNATITVIEKWIFTQKFVVKKASALKFFDLTLEPVELGNRALNRC